MIASWRNRLRFKDVDSRVKVLWDLGLGFLVWGFGFRVRAGVPPSHEHSLGRYRECIARL